MKDLRKANFLVASQFLCLGALFLLVLLNRQPRSSADLLAEGLFILGGGVVILTAAASLKPSLRVSPIPKPGSPFIASGIYKYLRHPMYLGVILVGLGMAGAGNSSVSLIFIALLIITLNIKAKFEDRLLLEIHPEVFHYQMHTSKILPCLGGSCRDDCTFKE